MPTKNVPRTLQQLARRDIASLVVHWTKAQSEGMSKNKKKTADKVLDQILNERYLSGGSNFIRGKHTCICFTEAPLAEMVSVFALSGFTGLEDTLRYEPFGVGVPKEWLFKQGGRPIIYQADDEYDVLPPSLQWRHCRYEPPDIDFTWEREWRIQKDRLVLDPALTWVFVPTAQNVHDLNKIHPEWRILPLELFGLPER